MTNPQQADLFSSALQACETQQEYVTALPGGKREHGHPVEIACALQPVDTSQHAGAIWCGPYAIAAITGKPYAAVLDAIRTYRRARGEHSNRAIMRLYPHEIIGALRALGYIHAKQHNTGKRETMGQWLEMRPRRACILFITGHYIAVDADNWTDNGRKNREPRPVSTLTRTRRRVKCYITAGAIV